MTKTDKCIDGLSGCDGSRKKKKVNYSSYYITEKLEDGPIDCNI